MQGAYTALITPFTDIAVDYESLEKLIEFQIANGIDGLVPVGTTGESPTLSHDEHKEVIKFTVKKVNGRCKVIAGAGSNSTSETLELTQFSKEVGADAVLLACPYYNKPTQEGLYEHYKTIAQSVNIDIVLYNIPGRSAVEISPDTQEKLAAFKNIVAVKDATGNIDLVSEIISRTKTMSVISGNDSMVLPLMVAGGKGVISVTSNLFPKEMKELTDLCLEGSYDKARELHYKLWEINKVLFCKTNPIPVKCAAYQMGLIKYPHMRLPLFPLGADDEKKVVTALNNLGVKTLS